MIGCARVVDLDETFFKSIHRFDQTVEDDVEGSRRMTKSSRRVPYISAN
jgi:hypothetical protein